MNLISSEEKWESNFFFTHNFKGEAQCIICFQIIQTNTKYNIERHFKRHHADNIADGIAGGSKEQLVSELMNSFLIHDAERILEYIESNADEINMQRSNIESTFNGPLKASYLASLSIAQNCKPFSDGIFIKKICKEMLSCFGESGNLLADEIEKVRLSRHTVARRIEELSKYADSLLKEKFKSCAYFSLALDESCDISDISQLMLAVRMVDDNFNVNEEIFALIPLLRNTRGIERS